MLHVTSHHHRKQSVTLPYAVRSVRQNRLPVRRIVICSILLSFAVATALWGPAVRNRIELLYWQSRCLDHTPAPGQMTGVPHAWSRFAELWSPPGVRSDGTPYLHQRVSPAGNRRLVALDLGWSDGQIILARLIVPAGFFSRAKEASARGFSLPFDARVVAAHSDPLDASHFTLECQIGSQLQIIDGWLRDDDLVLLEPRRPFTSSPSSASPPRPASGETAERQTSGR